MVAMRGCDLRGEASLNSFTLSVPIWIVDSTVVRPTNCSGGLPAPCWLNSLPYGDMLDDLH